MQWDGSRDYCPLGLFSFFCSLAFFFSPSLFSFFPLFIRQGPWRALIWRGWGLEKGPSLVLGDRKKDGLDEEEEGGMQKEPPMGQLSRYPQCPLFMWIPASRIHFSAHNVTASDRVEYLYRRPQWRVKTDDHLTSGSLQGVCMKPPEMVQSSDEADFTRPMITWISGGMLVCGKTLPTPWETVMTHYRMFYNNNKKTAAVCIQLEWTKKCLQKLNVCKHCQYTVYRFRWQIFSLSIK